MNNKRPIEALIESPLTCRSIARSLLPGILLDEKGYDFLNEFLIWPPDLFAFTSSIFSHVGAYHFTISPPPKKKWPPPIYHARENYNWCEEVRQLGREWRQKLENLDENTMVKEKGIDQDDKIMWLENMFRGTKANKREIREATTTFIIDKTIPKGLRESYWKNFIDWLKDEYDSNIADLLSEKKITEQKNWNGFVALVSLHAIADEAGTGWGVKGIRIGAKDSKSGLLTCRNELKRTKIQEYAEYQLTENGTLSHISNTICRVLPKRHTPNVGITLRSMSGNLAFHRSSIDVNWKISNTTNANNRVVRKMSGIHEEESNGVLRKTYSEGIEKTKRDSFSVLLLPWPLEVHGEYFKPSEFQLNPSSDSPPGYFNFSPPLGKKKSDSIVDIGELKSMIEKAKKESADIDMVVFPESALNLMFADARSKF